MSASAPQRTRILAASDRLYRLLLRACPSPFRTAYGGLMAQAFRDVCRDAYRTGGATAVVTAWPAAVADLLLSAAAEHATVLGGRALSQLALVALGRLFDLAVAAAGLLVVAPLLPLVVMAIKLDSPGPVLYAPRCRGEFGREFHLYKFRTMVATGRSLDPAGTGVGAVDRLRITPTGRFLRRTCLDELPLLWSVLKGDLRVFGPLPIFPDRNPAAPALGTRPGALPVPMWLQRGSPT